MSEITSRPASWYPGSCSIKFTHSKEPLILPTKDGQKRAFRDLCNDVTPPCCLNPFLFNGHLQTAWTAAKFGGPHIHYKRRVMRAENPAFDGHFAVDFVVPAPKADVTKKAEDGGLDDQGLRDDPTGVGHHRMPPRTTYFTDKEFADLGSDDTKPLLVTLHGLSGGSYEVYLRHVLEPLIAATPEGAKAGISGGDWEALVVNSRGCAGSKVTSSMLYNARATWDIRQVVKWAREQWPNRPIFGIGYSLGANILTNYIAEEGANCILSSAVVVANPFKLEVSSLALQRTWIGMEVYSKAMGKSMRALYNTHKEQIIKNKAIDAEKIESVKYLHEFDREVQCATWGYPTETAYYRDASSSDGIMAIRIPTFFLHAEDDPIACDEAVPYEEIKQNPHTVLCATSGGGHLSWFELGGGRWHAKPAVAFLNAMAREIDLNKFEPFEMQPKGPRGGHLTPFVYEPTRRKLYIPGSEKSSNPGLVDGS